MNLNKLITTIAALVAVAAVTASSTGAAASAPVPTGSWVGSNYQNLANLDHQYKTKFVITAYRGRLLGVVGQVRMECPNNEIWDARLLKSFKIGRGPRLSANGTFATSFKTSTGAYVQLSGRLAKRSASGAVGASATLPVEGSTEPAHCVGRGAWLAKRRY